MPSRTTYAPVFNILILSAILLWIWTRFAEPWAPSLVFYAGLTVCLAGLASLLYPLRFLAIRTRPHALLVAISGVAIAAAAILWPVSSSLQSSTGGAELDQILPQFHRAEKHEIRLQTSVENARAAMDQVAFSDIAGLRTLMSIRAGRNVQVSSRPVLATMTAPGSNFLRLAATHNEFVAGNVGTPWANQRPAHILDTSQFRDFSAPGYAKVAFNMRVEPAEPGWCKVTTETRIFATSESARQAFTRYWRVVYPGSALIRLMWLNALQRRLQSA